jgi:hypothetical protein
MLHLKVVKSAKEEKAISTNTAGANKDEDDGNDDTAEKGGKGTRVLLELMEPWHHSGRVVIADVYFASVKAAMKMKEKGLFFIGNVKQCSRRFLMEVLGNATLAKRGSRLVLAWIDSKTSKAELAAMRCVDRNRRFLSQRRSESERVK